MGDPREARPPRSEEPGAATGVRAGDRELTGDDLVYLNRMTVVGHVLPNVAHELNNALQVVGGLVEMLGARADLPADVREKVGKIGVQAGRAMSLVRDVVEFARGDDAGVRAVDVARQTEQALALRRYHLSRAGIAVEVERAGEGALRARGDAHDLRHILLNLLINAEQALAGRGGGRIHVRLDADGERVRVAVTDNGPGLPDGVRRVGEPFATSKAGAVGLGLAVASRLAAGAGGRLDVEPASPRGMRVVLSLPGA